MIQLIPAIDLIGGHCVRLAQGDYSRKTDYSASPVDLAIEYEKLGYTRLHLVDLDGAKQGKPANLDVLGKICSETKLHVDFGGGIKTDEDLRNVFDNGAEAVSIGSMAVNEFETVVKWIETYGANKFIISADVRNGKVRTHGWTEDSGMTINNLLEKYWHLGVRNVLCTDISRDGMLCGSNIELYTKIMKDFPDCKLIASGGISNIEDIISLDKSGIPAVVFGRAIYEGLIDLKQLAQKFNLTPKI